jgi:hypothetical protein
MTCDAIRAAMAAFEDCEETLDGSRIATHCLYPSFESVHVYVVKVGDGYRVHDGCGAFHTAWDHGRDERGIEKALSAEAVRYHLSVDHNRLIAKDVPSEWLRSAILAVANASASAAAVVVSRAAAAAEADLVTKIDEVLTKHVAPAHLARSYSIRGLSGGDRHFDFAIRREKDFEILINAVSSHHASYAAKYVSFSDVDYDLSSKLAVRDGPLKTDVQSLMMKVATIVPLGSLGHSRVSQYAN